MFDLKDKDRRPLDRLLIAIATAQRKDQDMHRDYFEKPDPRSKVALP